MRTHVIALRDEVKGTPMDGDLNFDQRVLSKQLGKP